MFTRRNKFYQAIGIQPESFSNEILQKLGNQLIMASTITMWESIYTNIISNFFTNDQNKYNNHLMKKKNRHHVSLPVQTPWPSF